MYTNRMQTRSLDIEQRKALTNITNGHNIFLHGSAGTGKSLVIEEFVQRTNKRVECLAVTANAARNVCGHTIHSAFALPIVPLHKDNIPPLHESQQERIKNTEVFIFDEVSMIRSDLFEAADIQVRKCYSGKLAEIPFAGKQVILSGDMLQLPPIVENPKVSTFLYDNFGGPYIFQTQLFKELDFKYVILTQVHRQNELKLIQALEGIRKGELMEYGASTSYFLNKGRDVFFIEEEIYHLETLNELVRAPDLNDKELVYLSTTKAVAEERNRQAYLTLTGKEYSCFGNTLGVFPKYQYPVPINLNLKIGQQVMIIANKYSPSGSCEFINGDLGTLVEYSSTYKPLATVQLHSGRTVQVEQYTWEYYDYQLITHEESTILETTPTGTYQQLPLIPAYALTIHKTQGKSLNSLHLDLGKSGCFEVGQLYTGLSRCRFMDRLTIDRPLEEFDVMVSQEALRFEEKITPREISQLAYDLKYGR